MAIRCRCRKLFSPSDGAVGSLQGASGSSAWLGQEYLAVQAGLVDLEVPEGQPRQRDRVGQLSVGAPTT